MSGLGKIKNSERLISIIVPIIAGLILLVCAIMNLNSSIWFDEAYSAYLVRGDFKQIWEMTAVDVHPPLFYFLLKIWSIMFGTSAVAMRFMSVFFGLIAIVFIFHLVKKWFGVKVASLAALTAAVSPMLVRYSQEMRMYTLVLLIVVMATYYLTLALEKGTERSGRKYWVIYAVLMAIGMWTHYFSAFMWIAQLVLIVKKMGGVKTIIKETAKRRTILLVYSLAAILYLPWLPSFYSQVKTVQAGFWIPPVSFETMGDFTASLLFFNKAQEVTGWGLMFGLLLLVGFGVGLNQTFKTVKAEERQKLKDVIWLIVAPFLVMTVLSLPPLTSSFVDRYILYSIVLFWALLGIIVGLLKNKRLKIILASLVIIVAGLGVSFVENRKPRGYIKEIVAETFAVAKEGEPIIADGVWTYYDGVFYSSEKHPIYLFENEVDYKYGSLEPIRNYRVNVVGSGEEFLKDKKSVWFVTDRSEGGNGYRVPEWAKEMRIETEILLDHNAAVHFVKD